MSELTDGRKLLESLRHITDEIQKEIDKVAELRSLAINITVCSDKDNVQTSSSKDKIGEMVAKIVDMENAINELTDGLIDRKNMAKKVIFKIKDEKKQNILYDYYICNRNLLDIAEEYKMTFNNCKVTKNRAIKEFIKIFDEMKQG